MKFFFLIYFFFSISLAYGAENYIVYFGGGGEPTNKDTTIFDRSIPSLAMLAKAKNYKAEYYFTKQHRDSMRIAEKAIGHPTKEFTSENWKEKIDQLKKDIENGKITGGSNLLLAIDTHGIDVDGEMSLSTTNGSIKPTEDLKQLIQMAETKNVKIAITATNCTSGNLLKLSSQKTCIITSSMPKQLGYSTDIRIFHNLNKSNNLEDAFLLTRKENGHVGLPSQPAVSSPAGLETQKALSILFPYLSMEEVKSPGVKSICNYTCSASLNAFRKEIEEIAQPIDKLKYALHIESDPQILIDLVNKYNKAVGDYAIASGPLYVKEKCYETPVPFFMGMYGSNYMIPFPGGMGITQKEFKNLSAKTIRQNCLTSLEEVEVHLQHHREKLGEAISSHSPIEFQKELKESIRQLNKLKIDPKIKMHSRKRAEKPTLIESSLNTMIETRKEIAQLERKIYDQLYQKYSEELKNQTNPCRDFTL